VAKGQEDHFNNGLSTIIKGNTVMKEFQITGRLGKDAVINARKSGDKEVKQAFISLAVQHYVRRNGQSEYVTDWFEVAVFAPNMISLLEKRGKKGASFFVRGMIETNRVEHAGQYFNTVQFRVGSEGHIEHLADAQGSTHEDDRAPFEQDDFPQN
jgi:single-stranded DNA-binding protein